MQQIKRIGICILSEHNNAIFEADMHLLQKAKKQIESLYIAYKGGYYSAEMDQKLRQYAKEIVVFTPTDSDLFIYCKVLEQIKISSCGFDEYSEIWLFNNSFLGPFYDLSELFRKMQFEECDFWGLLYSPEKVDENWNNIQRELSSGFLVVRSSLFMKKEFMEFFFEAKSIIGDFLNYFSQRGYEGKTYIDVPSYISIFPQNNFDLERYISFQLIKDYKYPFLKKDCFRLKKDDFEYGINKNLSKTIEYIKNFTKYDIDMIWDVVLANCPISELYQQMHFNYILPEKTYIGENDFDVFQKTVVIVHLYYMDLLDEVFSYLSNIPVNIDIIITSEKKNHELLHQYAMKLGRNDIIFLAVGDKGRDIAALLITAHDYLLQYEYLCFIHDKKTTGKSGPVTIGEDFRYIIWDNLLKSKNYIENILKTFQDNLRLGVLAPPEPFHGEYFSLMGNRWAGSQKATESLLKKLNVQVNLTEADEPFALSASFWCRTAALKDLFTYPFTYEDFPEEPLPLDGAISHGIERCLIYVAQKNGYFSGILENTDFAKTHINGLQRMLSAIIKEQSQRQYFTSFKGFIQSAENNELVEFCRKYHNIYIYGAGAFGIKVRKTLQNQRISVSGFIVSDGQTKKDGIDLPCYYLSEIEVSKQIGIIVSATKTYKAEMIQNLRQKGWESFFCKDL